MTTTIQETTAPQSPVVEPDVERRARVLEAAALEIEVRGWCRSKREDENGSVCLVGGIHYALGDNLEHFEYAHAEAIWFGQEGTVVVSEWNDCDAVGADEVAFLLRWRAAELRDGWDAA